MLKLVKYENEHQVNLLLCGMKVGKHVWPLLSHYTRGKMNMPDFNDDYQYALLDIMGWAPGKEVVSVDVACVYVWW